VRHVVLVALCLLTGCAGIGQRQLALGQACSRAHYEEGEVMLIQNKGDLKVGDPEIINHFTSKLEDVCKKTYPSRDNIEYANVAADELYLLARLRSK
jgi:hypothetical protein